MKVPKSSEEQIVQVQQEAAAGHDTIEAA